MEKKQKILIILAIFLIGMNLIRLWIVLTSGVDFGEDVSREYRSISLGIAIGILFLISPFLHKFVKRKDDDTTTK